MCKCTPSIRTPFCGKFGCEWPGQKPDDTRARLKGSLAAEKDPVLREAYALAERAGYVWYDTESSARRAFEHAAGEIVELRAALKLWDQFFAEMPKGQLGKIVCDIDLLNDAFLLTAKALTVNP